MVFGYFHVKMKFYTFLTPVGIYNTNSVLPTPKNLFPSHKMIVNICME